MISFGIGLGGERRLEPGIRLKSKGSIERRTRFRESDGEKW